ncbi:hypothetical protein ES708_25290 [subsurface metagenome]
MKWDSSGEALDFVGTNITLSDADYIKFGDTGEISMRWTSGDIFEIATVNAASDMYLGTSGTPLDVKFATTGTDYMKWDSSGEALDFVGTNSALLLHRYHQT